MNDWNIQSRSRICHGCENSFEDQQIYHSLLFIQKGTYERQDVCDVCWKNQFSDASGATKGFVSHWRGRYQAPPPPPPEAIRKDTAESLLKKLAEKKLPQYGGALYILAVMLERKRILKVRDQIREKGQRIFIYEQPKTGDVFTITEPDLSLDQLERIQYDVAELMEKGLPEDENPGAESNPEASTATEPSLSDTNETDLEKTTEEEEELHEQV